MRFVGAFACIVQLGAGFDLTGLLNHIRSETLNFDQMVDGVKTKEENQIHEIELKERDVDRELEAVAEKYHFGHRFLENDSASSSFLEARKSKDKLPEYSNLKKVTPHQIVSKSDVKALEKTELNREAAEKNLVQVEAQIADMPERLLHTKERRIKEDKDVPLDEVTSGVADLEDDTIQA
jgi:hypothetical protein